MMPEKRTFPWRAAHPSGDGALLLDFGDRLDHEINRRVQKTAAFVHEANIFGVWGVVPAFTTLLIEFDPLQTDAAAIMQRLEAVAHWEGTDRRPRLFEIPVCYGGELGPDIDEVAQAKELTVESVINIHTGTAYTIYCIGFSPGFPLCGILPEALQVPRRGSPRTAVPAGSVAIAGGQTGVYPLESPGGWNILGRTPAALFHLHATPPILYEPGDALRFRAISSAEYDELKARAEQGENIIREVGDAEA